MVARMGSIRQILDTAFRDFEVPDDPASGVYEPEKAYIRALGPLLEHAISRASLGALVTDAKAQAAQLSLAAKDKSVALVFADDDDANNDLWLKTGDPGAGAWINTGALASAIGGLGQPYADEAGQSAEAASLSEQAAALSAETAQAIADTLTRYAIGGPLPSGEWRVITGRPRAQLTGTGSVVFDSRTSAGAVSAAVESYAVSGAQDLIRYPYFGDVAVEIRATITGNLLVEII